MDWSGIIGALITFLATIGTAALGSAVTPNSHKFKALDVGLKTLNFVGANFLKAKNTD